MDHSHHQMQGEKSSERALIELIICSALTLPLLIETLIPLLPTWATFILATVVQFVFGATFYRNSYQALKMRMIGMDVLVTLGTSAAYLFSSVVFIFGLKEHLYFETGAIIITLVRIGRYLEQRASEKTSGAVKSLMQLQPKMARVKREGQWVALPVAEMVIDDIFQVRPGEKVPIDGVVISGDSHVDESMLTGESEQIHKQEGMNLFAGTQNSNGVLEGKATAVGDKTALATIIELVNEAQASRAPVQNLADTVSGFFVPLVLGISLATLIVWWLTGNFAEAIVNAVAVLVVACPCAVGLAIPTVIMVAVGKAAQAGILVRNAQAIEKAKNLKTILLDKTGTLTEGKPKLVDKPEPELVEIAAALESASEHPIAQVIAQEGSNKSVTQFQAISGKGVEGVVDNKLWRVGSVRWMRELGLEFQEPEGPSVICLADEQQVAGFFIVSDVLRGTTKRGITLLKSLDLELIMVTGDQEEAAKRFASELEIDYRAQVLPGDKANVVKSYEHAAMVGDGINDAPALAAASVGFAMRTGTDIAMEAADITLMHNDLKSVYDAISLSKKTFYKVWQNLFFAFIYNIVGIVLAVFGLLNPIFAGFAMAASSLCVVGNALLLNRWHAKKD
ncbi:MAG: putative copper-importing P-type ATPase A [Chlamydiales bacterium]|nr:putative copper-importing P-type ATPase A [Chlamydiales bacterium]MCH9636184.1 putative copper-importing P-type ATPase A [Chlamydiales bacterium]